MKGARLDLFLAPRLKSVVCPTPGQVDVGVVIFLTEEAGFAIVSALHNGQGHAIEGNPRATGHKQTVAVNPSPFLMG